ncbi:lysosome membrane protein 2-like [Pollicipes pollicipes]|uniref:lysosome membrane protein 2-like n=1 Tax=Pollicipes pollicipes TaxID=41117 RepID=UPI001884E7A9|nr:lysosome membrane protein 2-like [Pollicipes pollicipes]
MQPGLKYGIVLGVGLGLLVLGCVLGWYGFPTIIDNMIEEQMVLTTDSESFDPWQSPTSQIDVYMQFIVFNVTNEKIGRRGNLIWSQDGTQLTYNEIITYEFDSATSGEGLSEDTTIVTINAPMLVVATMGDSQPPALRNLLYNIINSKERGQSFMAYKAGELLMSGVDDPLFAFVASALPQLLPPSYSDGLFRLYAFNNTIDGPYTVLTGKNDINHFTYIQSYQNSPKLSYWGTPYCNEINGTDGITYPPHTDDVQRVFIFNKDLCRSIYLDYEKDVEYFGITGRRFVPPREVLEDPAVNKDNQCFCIPAGNCLKAGVLSLSPCQYGAPIVASTPHFYNGDQSYVDAVIGMSPDKVRHETFIDIEPMTGLALNGGKKIQINLQLKQYPKVHGLEHIPEILFPLIYTNETATIDQKGADDFDHQLKLPLKLLKAAQWVLISVGIVMMLISVALWYRNRSRLTTV